MTVRRPHGTHLGRRLSRPIALLAFLSLLALTGCGAPSDPSPATATSQRAASQATSPTTSTTARQAAEAAVIRDYTEFWEDYVAVSATADYDSARLARYATGDALRQLRFQLLAYHERGLVAVGRPVRTGTRVTSLRGRTATVAECLDANRWRAHDAETGEPAGRPDGKTNQVRATLTLTDGRWKVSKLEIQVIECDA